MLHFGVSSLNLHHRPTPASNQANELLMCLYSGSGYLAASVRTDKKLLAPTTVITLQNLIITLRENNRVITFKVLFITLQFDYSISTSIKSLTTTALRATFFDFFLLFCKSIAITDLRPKTYYITTA